MFWAALKWLDLWLFRALAIFEMFLSAFKNKIELQYKRAFAVAKALLFLSIRLSCLYSYLANTLQYVFIVAFKMFTLIFFGNFKCVKNINRQRKH